LVLEVNSSTVQCLIRVGPTQRQNFPNSCRRRPLVARNSLTSELRPTQAINVIMLYMAHCYIFKSFLGLRNGNAFTEAETGEPPISCQNALRGREGGKGREIIFGPPLFRPKLRPCKSLIRARVVTAIGRNSYAVNSSEYFDISWWQPLPSPLLVRELRQRRTTLLWC